jgi:hypothetical protein
VIFSQGQGAQGLAAQAEQRYVEHAIPQGNAEIATIRFLNWTAQAARRARRARPSQKGAWLLLWN